MRRDGLNPVEQRRFFEIFHIIEARSYPVPRFCHLASNLNIARLARRRIRTVAESQPKQDCDHAKKHYQMNGSSFEKCIMKKSTHAYLYNEHQKTNLQGN